MDSTQPILSICIPTYNRADVLEKCLDSIVSNDSFNENIEVVISDNHSDDDTPNIVAKYTKYYSNIKYNRNNENIGGERNFIKVLNLATGKFRKLHNDYSIFTKEGLGVLYNAVIENIEEKPLMLFGDWGKDIVRKEIFTDFNQFVRYTKSSLSWIGLHGFWEEDFANLPDKERKIDSQFMQIDWCLRLFKIKKKLVLYEFAYLTREYTSQPQGGYDFFETHITKFLSVYREYVKTGDMTYRTFSYLSEQVCRFAFGWLDILYFHFPQKEIRQTYSYDMKSPFKILIREFWKYPWFYYRITKYMLHILRMQLKTNH